MSDQPTTAQFRLTPDELFQITGRRRVLNQASWFKQYLGVVVPCDAKGPIINKPTYDALVARRVGLDVPTHQRGKDVVIHSKDERSQKRATGHG